MKCEKCGEETFLPFQCPYCGGRFCTAHRLPENHDCQKMELARASKQEVVVLTTPSSYEYTVSFGQQRQTRGRVYFSPKELKHLTVAALLVVGIGFSSIIYLDYSAIDSVINSLIIFATVLTASFLAHEIAHKISAQKRGLWAEFRLTLWGSALTLISIITPVFKIIAPGAMMVSGSTGIGEMGKISLAGPATNIVSAGALLSLGLAFSQSSLSWAFYLGAFLNGFMAVFNLIPFGIFDGLKVFNWDKKVWAVSFGISAALMVVAYVLLGW